MCLGIKNIKKDLIKISSVILSGKQPAKNIKESILSYLSANHLAAKLAVIMIGDNQASKRYIAGKKKDCEECGINFELIQFSEAINQFEVEQEIIRLNNDNSVNGILIQFPLPQHLNKDKLIKLIDPNKDVDCFTEINLGKMFLGNAMLKPCTPSGIIELFNYYDIPVKGKHCVIIGRSNIVGKPLAVMLINEGATLTVCNSMTKNLKELTLSADILISAVGIPYFITSDMVTENTIIIDVGINVNEEGKLCGDVDFENVKDKVKAITPVPGGVGLMTRAILMKNVVEAAYGNVLKS